MLKSYALFDVIGISKAYREGCVNELLNKFWIAVDSWTNQGYAGTVRRQRDAVMEQADVQVAVFSDSALLTTVHEYVIEDFYKIVNNLKAHIERHVGPTYCIINRDEAIEPSLQLSLGGRLVGSDMMPRFIFIAGSGLGWCNLWEADKAVKAKKDWHDYYSLYCVDRHSKPPLLSEKDRYLFKGFDSKEHLLIALE